MQFRRGWGGGVGLAVSIFHKLPRLTGSGMLLEHGLFFEHQGPTFLLWFLEWPAAAIGF